MSYFSDFGAAAFGSLASNVQADIDSERSLKEKEKLMEIEEKLRKKAEETRVAAKRMFTQKGNPNAQSPWVSKDAGYMNPQGEPDRVMVEEFNNQGKPISTRPAGPGEAEEYTQGQAATALAQQKIMNDMERQSQLDASTIDYRKAQSEKAGAQTDYYRDRQANPGKYKSNPAAPKGPDYDNMLKQAAILRDQVEDPAIKAEIQTAITNTQAALNENADPSVAAQMLVIALRQVRQGGKPLGKSTTTNFGSPSGQKLD